MRNLTWFFVFYEMASINLAVKMKKAIILFTDTLFFLAALPYESPNAGARLRKLCRAKPAWPPVIQLQQCKPYALIRNLYHR
jgi:hypothetical protein